MTDMDSVPMMADALPSELMELEGYINDLEGAIQAMQQKAIAMAEASGRRGDRIDAKLAEIDRVMALIPYIGTRQ